MWQQIADFIKTAFTVNQTLARHENDMKALDDRLNRATKNIERLCSQFETFQKVERLERENFMLEVRLHLAESGKRLPPPTN